MEFTILIMEDEDSIRRVIIDYLRLEGFNVLDARDGVTGMIIYEENNVDLVIVDIMMPELDGWGVCKRIRKQSDVPIIILTARGEVEDELMGFELKANDYIKKPFSPAVLVARVNSLLNRLKVDESEDEGVLSNSGVEVNLLSREVKISGVIKNLTPKEFDILLFFMENANRVLSREKILNTIWGYDYFGDTRVVDTHVKKIRKILGEKAYLIRTVFGVGYKFEVKEVKE